MAHPRWPGFNEKTGDPTFDNQSRNLNRRMYRDTKRDLRFTTPSGRRRLKHLKTVEGGNYLQLLVAVMNDLAGRDRGKRL
jgi:hypothetical protein